MTEPLTPAEQAVAFRQTPLPLPTNTFGLGLVLGGTVSAGAFTAGVLDFLTEALDEWQQAKEAEDRNVESGRLSEEQRMVPAHNVSLAIITGSSGGGVNGAILSRFLGYEFPHVRLSHNSPANANLAELVPPLMHQGKLLSFSDNPYWDVWINKLRIDGFLTDKAPEQSILSDNAIEDAAHAVARDLTGQLPSIDRRWIHGQFNLVLALTNLRGIPAKIDYPGGRYSLKQSFVNHAEFIRFGIAHSNAAQRSRTKACHESVLLGPLSTTTDWAEFSEFGIATGAFPVGLPAKSLNRCIADYRYIPVKKSRSDGKGVDVCALDIDAAALNSLTGSYPFTAVDAGVTNNAPVELAREYLAGIGGHNKRESHTADRAVIFVDPFAETADVQPLANNSIIEVIKKLILSGVAQSRYHTRDLALAGDINIKSRFLITAFRTNPQSPNDWLLGAQALCSTRIGAFFGFFDAEFSKHDFFLGRYCCQQFLQQQNNFALREDNPVLGMARANRLNMKPIIPLFGTAAIEQKMPKWPVWNTFKAESIKPKIHARIKRVVHALLNNMVNGKEMSWYKKIGADFLIWLNKTAFMSLATNKIIASIENAKNSFPKL
ncbi:MAG: hypothetical protein CTY23_08110 [Methylomonas sp.]|nr:MAG: hypothetical protein CTY23_08110 [Methylomonas sp.]